MKKLLLLYFILTSYIWSASYYLATTGVDTNAGTQAAPFLTLQKAFNVAQAGDVINLGVGNFGSASTVRSGTSTSPITIQGIAGSEALAITNIHSYYIYNNIKLTGRINFNLPSTNCIVQDCVFDPIGTIYGNNIAMQAGTLTDKGIRPSGHIIRRNQFLNAKANGVGVSLCGRNHLVEGNYFSSQTGADAVWIFANDSTIRGNTFQNWTNLSGNPVIHADLFQSWGNNSDVALNCLIENNLGLDCLYTQLGNVTDDKRNLTIANWTWRNNVWIRVSGPLNLYSPGHKFLNETYFESPRLTHSASPVIRTSTDRGSAHNTTIYNCIWYKAGSNPANTGHGFYGLVAATGVPLLNFVADYNSVIGVGAGTIKAGSWTSSGRNVNGLNGVDPLFVNGINPMTAAEVALTANSPAILEGIDLSSYFNTDHNGAGRAGWDMGAIAYTIGTPGNPAPPPTPPTDTTVPTILSSTIDSTGTQLNINYSENITGVNVTHYTIADVTLSAASGTGSVRTFTITPAIITGVVKTLGYTSGSGRTADITGNLLATASALPITNSSLVPVAESPKKIIKRRIARSSAGLQ
jgi:hypothetical protein